MPGRNCSLRGRGCRTGLLAATLAVVGISITAGRPARASDGVESFAEPNLRLDLAANEPGVVDVLTVKEGQSVQAGQLVASLDVDVLQSQMEVFQLRAKATGSMESASAELEVSEQRLAAIQELDARGHANTSERQRAIADVRIARAALQNVLDEQKVMSLEAERVARQIRRRQIYSPIDGIVVKIHRKLGESVSMTHPDVVTVAQLDPLRVHFPVTAKESVQLRNGQMVNVRFPELDAVRPGTIELVSPVMDAGSRTVNVTVLIENKREPLIAGTRCILETGSNSSAEPRGAPLAQDLPRDPPNRSDRRHKTSISSAQ